jgi:Peptidase family M1 domain
VTRRPTACFLLVLGAVVLLAACGTSGPAPEGPSAGPATYDPTLWPQRPVVTLSYTMADDLHTADGHETVVFTPDAQTCELVFRAWPNQPTMFTTGSSLVLTDARVDGRPVQPQMQAAGAPAGSPGTLIEIPLGQCVDSGRSVTADLSFHLTLGLDADERIGVSSETRTAWAGTGFPLLAWVRGRGWVRDPAVAINGESVTSEDFMLKDLSVTAPSQFAVAGTGTPMGERSGPDGTTVHTFSAPAVRDVSIAVGSYTTTDQDVQGVHVHLTTPRDGTRATTQQWADQVSRAITTLSGEFGPFPYPDLWVTITPGQSDGTEFPDAVQFSDTRARELPALVAHEVSHQWFYSLVGNDQSTDPWLDESLATFGEALAGGDADDYQVDKVPTGDMGQPMTYWADHGGFDAYTQYVYNQGAAVLLAARQQVGRSRFDRALRSYITTNAHRVATPYDFAHAFRGLPQVITALQNAGAIPNGA